MLLGNKGMLLRDKGMLLLAFVVVAEVLAAGRQLVMHQGGQHLAQLQEEPFARRVAVGVHVEGN